MAIMNAVRARNLDLNLLRVLVAVADTGSVTKAAARLYLTQSAVSAALARLSESLDTPVLVRHGRGVILTSRAARLVTEVRPLLEAMLQASLAPARFDPRTSERTIRLGLSDFGDEWLLPPLLRRLGRDAPKMRLVCIPVQFRTVVEALATRRVDLAATVIDKLPQAILRTPLIRGHFVCLFDPRHVRLARRAAQQAHVSRAGARHRLLQRRPPRHGRGHIRRRATRPLFGRELQRDRRHRRRQPTGGDLARRLRGATPAAASAPSQRALPLRAPRWRHGPALARRAG
ncbi:LysR family transcriptional regulator [Myxococcus sp. AM010]|uniref:LysR family transcriptional regulator n=1 Tax=Myxococcus sp. AM010 TaxID=2745138 RepID=UPI0020D10912|nr:LysR family transcriptional regulator [Myxococcus sp. AM010]